MPVVVVHEKKINGQLIESLERVIKDLEPSHAVKKQLEKLISATDRFDLWVGVFNERVVAFAILDGNAVLRALAVHKATRNRGVGRRLIDQLQVKVPAMSLQPGEDDQWLNRFYDQLRKNI